MSQRVARSKFMGVRLMTRLMTIRPLALALGLASSACSTQVPRVGAASADPQSSFLAALAQHCGKAYAGRIDVNTPAAASDAFAGKALVMHVRDCSATEVRIPFHVGEDRSRTWVLTRTAEQLRLKHDHRHEDGSSDVLTWYGGTARSPGTAIRQAFPADRESRALFLRQDLPVSVDNIWALEIEPGQRLTYELTRPNRVFRVVFDLTQTVPVPAPAWGYVGGK